MAFSFDDAWDNGPEVTRAGTAAFGLYCRCGAWSARNLQDGFVPSEIAAAYGSPEWVRKLLDVGLWENSPGGYWMPHYLDRNESAEKVRQRRKADAERKARWRNSKQPDQKSQRDSARSHSGSRGVSPRSLYPSPKGEEARAREAGRGASPVDKSVSDALRHPSESACPHGDPQGPGHCGFCRRGIPPAQEEE